MSEKKKNNKLLNILSKIKPQEKTREKTREKTNIEKTREKIEKYKNEYYNTEETTISDNEYDALEKWVDNKEGKNKIREVGILPTERKTKLPYVLPSLATEQNGDVSNIIAWMDKINVSSLIIDDKIDGISLTIRYTFSPEEKVEIFGRGNAFFGQNLSFLYEGFEGLHIPSIKECEFFIEKNSSCFSNKHEFCVRGEIAIKKKIFETLDEKKARNYVNGLLSRKIPDFEKLSQCDFLAFEIITETEHLTPKEQLDLLTEMNFLTPWFSFYSKDDIFSSNTDSLLEIHDERKEKSEYTIDGLVLLDNKTYKYYTDKKDPKNKMAFKKNQTIAASEIIDIEWGETSKDRYYNPVLIIEPVNIDGSVVSRISGKNAKNVLNNGLGIGAVILVKLSGTVIPEIDRIEVTSDNIPFPENYEWDETHTKIRMIEENDNVKIAQLSYFVTCLEIKNCGDKTLKKLYDAGIRTIRELCTLDINFVASLERFGDKSAQKLIDSINDALKICTFPKLMAGSCIFGPGISVISFKKLVKKYPNWFYDNLSEEDILEVEGFGDIYSKQVADNLDTFIKWFSDEKIADIIPNVLKEDDDSDETHKENVKGKNIVFSGFRDGQLKNKLERLGANVKSAVSGKTDLLIVSDINSESTKITEAKNRGIKILSINQLNI